MAPGEMLRGISRAQSHKFSIWTSTRGLGVHGLAWRVSRTWVFEHARRSSVDISVRQALVCCSWSWCISMRGSKYGLSGVRLATANGSRRRIQLNSGASIMPDAADPVGICGLLEKMEAAAARRDMASWPLHY